MEDGACNVTGDYYGTAKAVVARRLNPDGSYNRRGKLIKFYMSGHFDDEIDFVELVGRMRKTFVRVA